MGGSHPERPLGQAEGEARTQGCSLTACEHQQHVQWVKPPLEGMMIQDTELRMLVRSQLWWLPQTRIGSRLKSVMGESTRDSDLGGKPKPRGSHRILYSLTFLAPTCDRVGMWHDGIANQGVSKEISLGVLHMGTIND